MKVLVSDTSVLVDLERGELLEAAFALSYELAVPDLLFEQELANNGGERLVALGMRVEELDGSGVLSAQGYREQQPRLSNPDCFALVLARTNGWTLLTGDGLLRQVAEGEAVPCHGTLWLIDQMFGEAVTTAQALYTGLTTISEHPRCRLPKKELKTRLERLLLLCE